MLVSEEAVHDFGTGVTIADFQQSGKVAYKTLLLTNLVKSIVIQTGEALINFVQSPPPYDYPDKKYIQLPPRHLLQTISLVFLPIYEIGDVWEGSNSLTVH